MIDPSSGTWDAVAARAGRRMQALREELERPDLPESRTQFVRGELACLRWLLRLPAIEESEREEGSGFP